jgi:hypothetical protein
MATSMREDAIPRSNVVALTFNATDVPNAAGTAVAAGGTGNEYVMPFAGSIIGISAKSNAAFTTGTVTLRPTINGAANTGITIPLSSANQSNYASKPADTVRFAAGAAIGVDWTKTGTVAPTTNDLVITLFVLLEDML